MTLGIRELFYAANRYKKQNPDRFNVAADLLAYSALVDVLENPEKFGLAVLPTTNHKMVWETLVETGYEFELSDDFNAHIVDYLTDPYHPYAHKVMDVQVIKADVIFDGSEESVSFGVIPDGWDGYLDNHPLDDSVFYWLKPEEAENFGKGSRPAPEWTVMETY